MGAETPRVTLREVELENEVPLLRKQMLSKPMEKDEADGRFTTGWADGKFVVEISHGTGGVMTSLDQQGAQWLLERLMEGMDHMPGEYAQIAMAVHEKTGGAAEAAQAVEKSQGGLVDDG